MEVRGELHGPAALSLVSTV